MGKVSYYMLQVTLIALEFIRMNIMYTIWSRTRYADGTSYGVFYHYRDKEISNGVCTISPGISGTRGFSERCNKYAIRLVR